MTIPEWRHVPEEQPPQRPATGRPVFLKGSRPRCVRLVEESRTDRSATADLLSDVLLATPSAISVHDQWMPFGLPARTAIGAENTIASGEIDLTLPNPFLTEHESSALSDWWFGGNPRQAPTRSNRSKGPTWDLIASRGSQGPWQARPRGLVLVEAKAHHDETFARAPKPQIDNQSKEITESLGRHPLFFGGGYNAAIYQLQNRFAVGLKLAELGFEVELVLLGFLNADEMDRPFVTHEDWERHIQEVSGEDVYAAVWHAPAKPIGALGGSFRARIRSTFIVLTF